MPGRFYLFATANAASTLGLMTFGFISSHLVDAELVSPGLVPLVYALGMLTEAGAALVTGVAYDRWSGKVLLVLPFLVATVPVLTLADRLWVAVLGVAVWGGAAGVQESTVKALVADLVPARRLATAYGVFAAFEGVARSSAEASRVPCTAKNGRSDHGDRDLPDRLAGSPRGCLRARP